MCELTKTLDGLANEIRKKEHADIIRVMTHDERITFVNAVNTLMVHSDFIQKNTPWHAS